LVSSFVYPLEREELEVVLLIEPAALEEFQRQAGPPGQGERIDRTGRIFKSTVIVRGDKKDRSLAVLVGAVLLVF